MLDFASVSHNRLLSGRCQMDLCCRNTSRELLGSWPAISLRETIVARLEMKICTSTALVSISCKPIRAARGRSSTPCPAPMSSALCCTTGKAKFSLTRCYRLFGAMTVCYVPAMGRCPCYKTALHPWTLCYFQGKAFIFKKHCIRVS